MLRLLDLPSEVLDLICGFSMGTLKALRLTGTRISQASTPPLFRSITLVPHTTSFANLLALSRTKLARHVHEIVYDVRMLSSIPDIKMAFEANEFSLVGDSMDASRRKVFALLDEYEEKAFNSVETTEIEVSHLLEILPALPNLEHVRIVSGSLCELPYFYRTLKESMSITSDYYFETSNQSGHHARSVLLCLGALEIRIPKLSFIAVDWSEVVLFSELRTPARYLTMLQRVLRRLPKESLPLPMFSFLYTGEKADRGASLDDLLPVIGTVLDNVHDLTLSMATSRSERQLFLPTGPSFPLSPDLLCASLACIFGCMQTIGHLGPRSLRCLTLSSFVMQQAFLEDFLSGCGDTLAELTIGDLRLFTPYRSQQMVGESCLVDVLDMFSTHMKCLKSVELHGRFYNGGSQDWLVNGTKNKGTLKADVERWTVERGVCPLESERLIGGFQGTRAGDASFKIFRRTLEENPDGELDYDFPPTSENELLSAW